MGMGTTCTVDCHDMTSWSQADMGMKDHLFEYPVSVGTHFAAQVVSVNDCTDSGWDSQSAIYLSIHTAL